MLKGVFSRYFPVFCFCLISNLTIAPDKVFAAPTKFFDEFSSSSSALGNSWTRSAFVQSGGYVYAKNSTWAINPYFNEANVQIAADIMIPLVRTTEQQIGIMGRTGYESSMGDKLKKSPEVQITCAPKGDCKLEVLLIQNRESDYSVTSFRLTDNTGIGFWKGRLSLVIEDNFYRACVAEVCDQVKITSDFGFLQSGAVGIKATQGVYFDNFYAATMDTKLPGSPPFRQIYWSLYDTFSGLGGLSSEWSNSSLEKSGDGFLYAGAKGSVYNSFYNNYNSEYSLSSMYAMMPTNSNSTVNLFGWGKQFKNTLTKAPHMMQLNLQCAPNGTKGPNCNLWLTTSEGKASLSFPMKDNTGIGYSLMKVSLSIDYSSISACSDSNCVKVKINPLNELVQSFGKFGFGVTPGSYIAELSAKATNGNTTPGDADLNGCVDTLDYNIAFNHYNKYTILGSRAGDFNNDGIVDSKDLTILSNNNKKGC